jgi:hypothetical protein
MPNAIMMGASRAIETIPNMDAQFSFLPYKLCADGPGPVKAQLYSCMKFSHGGKIYKDLPVPFWAGQMTKVKQMGQCMLSSCFCRSIAQ